jgi:hypothetical protein
MLGEGACAQNRTGPGTQGQAHPPDSDLVSLKLKMCVAADGTLGTPQLSGVYHLPPPPPRPRP